LDVRRKIVVWLSRRIKDSSHNDPEVAATEKNSKGVSVPDYRNNSRNPQDRFLENQCH
jgi:hypothetical protein